MAGEVFNIRPLQLYAVTQQLCQGKPTCANGDAKTDLGHILDFTCRLRYLKVIYLSTFPLFFSSTTERDDLKDTFTVY